MIHDIRNIVQAASILAILAAPACSPSHRDGESAARSSSLPLMPPRGANGKFEGQFDARLRAADPARLFVALVDLTDQLDVRAFARRRRLAPTSKASERAAVIGALESIALRQQERLAPLIDSLRAGRSIVSVHPVAIVNRLIVEGTAAGVFALAKSPEVAMVLPDWTSERSAGSTLLPPSDSSATAGPTFPSWAIESMKADRLWRDGLDGTGVVVASIDTGAFEAHEQLRLRRVAGDRGWFDPVEGSTEAKDAHGHGTGVLSQAVGGNPDGRVVGVAPGARWASALGNWKNFYSRSRMTLAADWTLRVARPDVLVNAWSHDEGECSDFDRPFIDAWTAARIFVVFPAGNRGPGSATGESPAQMRGLFPDGGSAFSVGAFSRGGIPLAQSSRGPSRCGGHPFPTLALPGTELPIATTDGPKAYALGEGTSLSAGLAGGAAALLLQAVPETDPTTLARVLASTARDLAPPGRDDATGAGALDLEAALALLRAEGPKR